jgi:tetratricopeptide (TPR) repeat protein
MVTRLIVLCAVLVMTMTVTSPASAASVPEMEAAVSKALQADNRHDLEKAVAKLKKADTANPLLAQGLVRLVGMGNDALIYEALFTLNSAIAKNPKDMTLKRTRALFIVSAPWHRLAMADLEEVISAEDPGAVALKAFVDAAANNDRTDLGEARISELLAKRQNRDAGLLRARADIRYIRNDFNGVLKDVAAAITLSAPTLDDYLLRYRIHTKLGEDEAALADVDSMQKMLPKDKGLMRMRAALLIRLGRSSEASEVLEKANR